MTPHLQLLLDREEYGKAQKFVNSRKCHFKLTVKFILFIDLGLEKNKKTPFWSTIKIYCLLKLGKTQEAKELLEECKPGKDLKDRHTVKYLVQVHWAFG